MNPDEYPKMHALEQGYWWFRGRRRVVFDAIDAALAGRFAAPANDAGGVWGSTAAWNGSVNPAAPDGARPTILDIGCGTGGFLEGLEGRGRETGLDFSPLALDFCRRRGFRRLGRADVRQLPVRSGAVDLVTAIDLVEHIRDDRGLLGEFERVLKPGGHAVISVPAHPTLWSPHDVALHHFRRYTADGLRDAVEGAGLVPVRFTPAMATALAAAAGFRVVKRALAERVPPPPRGDEPAGPRDMPGSKPAVKSEPTGADGAKTDEFGIPGPLNALLTAMTMAEAAWLRTGANLPMGLSLLCVARKPA